MRFRLNPFAPSGLSLEPETKVVQSTSHAMKGDDGLVVAVVGGTNVTVDSTDPARPIVSASAGGVTDGDKGDVTVSGSGATWTIDNDVVTNAEAANMAESTIKGRAAGAGTGDPTDLTATQVRTLINVEDGADVTDAANVAAAGAVMEGDAAGGVLAGTYPNPSFASDMATQAELDAHVNDTTDAHDASAISFAPVGTIAATDAQTAIAEVASEASSALSTHEADTTSVHGIADTSTLYRAGGTDVAIADGGTGAGTAAAAFTALKQAASDTATGVVELATGAETTTGTDATRAVTPDGLAGSDYGKRVVGIQVVDSATATSTGDGKAYFRIPSVMNGWNLVAVAAHVYTAGTTNTTDVQVRRTRSGSSVDMLSTKITIDSTEVDTLTAAAAAVINATNDDVNTGDKISIDVDAVSTTPAQGLFVEMQFQLP